MLTPSSKGHPRYAKKLAYDRDWRRKNAVDQNAKARARKEAYRSEPLWYLGRKYDSIQNRVRGWGHSFYKGISLLPRRDFMAWAMKQPSFNVLFDQYTDAGRPRKLAPSIDRIDSKKGYIPGNMRFVTVSENTRAYLARRWEYGAN